MTDETVQQIMNRLERLETKLEDFADLHIQFVRLSERSERFAASLDEHRQRIEREVERAREAQGKVEEKAHQVMSDHAHCDAPKWVEKHNKILAAYGLIFVMIAGFLWELATK